MRAWLVVAAVMVMSALDVLAQGGPGSPETEAIRRQIEANEQAVGQAIHARDFAALEALWSPHMVVNAPDNTILRRDEVIAAMRRGGLSYASLRPSVERFEVFGDIAVEMGHEDFVMAGGPAAGKALQRRFTDVWQRSGGGWVQIARQATILGVDQGWVYGTAAVAAPAQPK